MAQAADLANEHEELGVEDIPEDDDEVREQRGEEGEGAGEGDAQSDKQQQKQRNDTSLTLGDLGCPEIAINNEDQ